MSHSTERRLLGLAALFLIFYALALTLAPAARAHSWAVEYSWIYASAVLAWAGLAVLAHQQVNLFLPDRDPYLLPIAALLSGWGLLTILRLYPPFGLRQGIWLLVALIVCLAGLRLPSDLAFLRRYKYIWLTGGLVLTGLTLLLGTNPFGDGFPRRWVGCCGVYLQPSEPLKLLLVIYLTAYLADWLIIPSIKEQSGTAAGEKPANSLVSPPLLRLLTPTLLMTGLVVVLLLIQRDLGTASIFLFLYTVIVYIATCRKAILAIWAGTTFLAGIAGYGLYDVVRVRIDAWLNPWADPSGRSFQIVQSLLAVANGGFFGRGPGLGNPGLVPVPHSDFIFASITEETGLVGAIGLLLLIGLFASRGLRIALQAGSTFQRYLAAGLTAYLGGQSILIIGGNLRLLPLTGVTLPFVSYGGSSLLTSFLALLILLHISSHSRVSPAPLPSPRPYLQLQALLLAGLGAAGLFAGWWTIYRSPVLLARTDNPRRTINDRFVRRGAILSRDNQPLDVTIGQAGSFSRLAQYPALSSILGYTHPVYGQAGLEASLDSYLRGLQGYPALTIWWNHLLYGQPPPGLDVRLTLDLNLQRTVDAQLGSHSGAAVLLNARSGEVLALASHPSFDPNHLDETWQSLIHDNRASLLDRAAQGLYAPGPALGPLLMAEASVQSELPAPPQNSSYSLEGLTLECALPPSTQDWGPQIAAGCPGPVAALGTTLGAQKLLNFYSNLGLYRPPELRLPADSSPAPQAILDPAAAALGQGLRVSPLQMAIAAAALSSDGERPAPSLVAAVNTSQAGWVILPPISQPGSVLPQTAALDTAQALAEPNGTFWQSVSVAPNGPSQTVTWYLAGTLNAGDGKSYILVVLLEERNPELAVQIGQTILNAAGAS